MCIASILTVSVFAGQQGPVWMFDHKDTFLDIACVNERRAVIVVTSGIIPPIFRRFCDHAAPLIRGVIKDSLNAKTVGDMYAGDIEHRGVDRYYDKAFKLGEKLAQDTYR